MKTKDYFHDDDHPDHVDDIRDLDMMPYPPLLPGDPESIEEPIVGLRRIYVREKIEKKPPIHTLKITIPVEPEPDNSTVISPPKPHFRLRKYSTLETKPEVEMVPVTTTIIKPVGVTKDQFIGPIPEGMLPAK